jgi:predicted GNAT superfamily acetyltransferase
MTDASLEIRTLDTAEEMAGIVSVFQQVWGSVTPIVGVELLRAIAHAGGYVAGAFDAGNTVGASFGFLGRHAGQDALHSHVTGILPGVQHGGVGRAMKTHQREWAAARDIPWITWTFDPLVRRNAWFNVAILGARIAEYLVNFYGPMSDSINSNDETDRILVAWPTDPDAPPPVIPSGAGVTKVATPDDIVVLRRTDPSAALAWRRRVRDELAPLLAAGGIVTDFTRDGEYVVAATDTVVDREIRDSETRDSEATS